MDGVNFRLHELPVVLGALSGLAADFSPKQQAVLQTILRLHGVCSDLEDLPRPPLAQVAAVITDEYRRQWLVKTGIILAMVDGYVRMDAAAAVAELARALDVDEPAVSTLLNLASRGFHLPAASSRKPRSSAAWLMH